MNTLPNEAAIRKFGQFLAEHGYDSDTLTERLGRARPPAEGEQEQMFDDSREITTSNVLIRLFLLGGVVDQATLEEFLSEPVVEFCLSSNLLAIDDGTVRARIVIVPIEDLLFASDAFHILGTADAGNFVLPASTHSANFLRFLTLRDPVDSTLDLGCGCGVHALFAARHSKQVVATDVSTQALWYTQFNAALNDIDNIDTVEGSLFEPLAGQTFDLIVSNPPFVISPSETFEYRDNPMELDEFCRALVREAPQHLNDGAHLQMLCEWVEIEGEPWQQRISDWIRSCDAWILHTPPLAPEGYVRQRASDMSGDSVDTGSIETWQQYFHKHQVRAVHPGMITLRKRDGENWLHIQNLTSDVTAAAGETIADGIDAVDFLEACDDDALLAATLMLADNLAAEEMRDNDQVVGVCLRLNNGLNTDVEIDGAVAAFLNLFSGKRTVRDCTIELGKVAEADPEDLTQDLLAIVRVFASRGFLVPIDLD